MVSLSFDYKRDYGFVISFKAFDLVFMVVETKATLYPVSTKFG